MMRWKLTLLVLLTLILIAAPFAPIDVQTIQIKIDLPPSAAGAPPPQVDQQVNAAISIIGVVLSSAYILSVLAGAALIGRRIVRKAKAARPLAGSPGG